MKIAIITANIGSFDAPVGIPRQATEHEIHYYYYTEHNLPYPLVNLDNRMKARYLKSQSHRFIEGYDVHIWLDGRVQVNGNNFVESFIDNLGGHDLAIYRHRERQTPQEEIDYIRDEIQNGSRYLIERYGNQQLEREAEFYQEQGLPGDYPLYTGGFYARRDNRAANACFDEWWQRIIEFSYSDQTMLSLVAWQHKLKVNALYWDEVRTPKLITVGKHVNNR